MSRMKKENKQRLIVSVRCEHRHSGNVKVREPKRWRVMVRDHHRVSGCRGSGVWGGLECDWLKQTGGGSHENK